MAVSTHFNGLSPAQAERLAMIAEEAGEIVQAVGKILRHGFDSRSPEGGPDNREALAREIADLHVCASLSISAGDFRWPVRAERVSAMTRKLIFAHHQPEGLANDCADYFDL